MKLTTEQKWLRTICWLRRNFPPPKPTYVRSLCMKGQGLCGETEFFRGYFYINVNKAHTYRLKIDTLLHEYAHVLTWFGAESDIEDHGAEWGITYAKLYRTFLEWDYGVADRPESGKASNHKPLPGQLELDF